MSKLISYVKALLPTENDTKSVRRLPHFNNLLPISPKDQNDIGGLVIPRVGANNWRSQADTDLEYLQKLYDCHDLVHSCIDLVSSTFAQAKLRVKKFDIKTQKYNYIPDHPIQTLLDNPNNSMTGFDLRQSYIVHRLLYGTVAFILLRDGMTISTQEANKCPICKRLETDGSCQHLLWHFNTGPVTQIIPVHLDRLSTMSVETAIGIKEYFIYNYKTKEGNEVKTLVHPNNILSDPKYNPGGSFYGSSPTEKVKRWLEIDLGLSTQIGAYLANNAIPSMILNIKPPKVGEGVRIEDPSSLLKMMEEKWMKDFSMASYNAGNNNKPKKPAFTFGDLEILKIQDGIKDIVQKDLFYEIQDRIARAYKVPRSFFQSGIEHGVVGKDQNENFYNYAISPELVSFKLKIERYILPSYNDPTIEIEWSLEDMGIAGFLIDKRNAFALKKWEMGVVELDQVREDLQLNPYHNPEEGQSRYRTSVMSDGSNNQVNHPDDNRLRSEPETARNAGLIGNDTF